MKPQDVVEAPVIDEAIWDAWIAKTKARERQTGQRMQFAAGVAACLLSIAGGLYLMQ